MYYKPDWDQAKERILAWWDGEIIDRAVVALAFAQRGHCLRRPETQLRILIIEQHQ